MTLRAGFEPLLKAISDGDVAKLKVLIKTGEYSVNEEVWYYSEDEKKYIMTPLYWAVKLNKREICRYLLQNGADPFKHMVYEYYPLHEACNNGFSGIIQEFIDMNCNLNKKNCDGDTPLHVACLRGHMDCIRLLLVAGANRNEKNNKGQTPLQAAQLHQQTKLYTLFEKEYSPSRSRLRENDKHKQVPLRENVGRRNSFSSYHPTTQDDLSVVNGDRLKSLRQDVTRTFSYSGSNLYSHGDVWSQGDLVRHSKTSHSNKRLAAQHPSLLMSYASHDSQLVLPTQTRIPDPRRTQTFHDFKSLPQKIDHRRQTTPDPPLTPDDVEVDNGHQRTSSSSCSVGEGRVRVNHIVQCIHPALKPRDVSDSVDTCFAKMLFSIHNEIGFSDKEYTALRQLACEREAVHTDRPAPTRQTENELEYVWGCDYSLVHRHPVQIVANNLLAQSAELIFHVLLENGHVHHSSNKNSLLKVFVCFTSTEEAGQFDYTQRNFYDMNREGRIVSMLSPHPNIAKYFHHCYANSRPFDRFLHLISQQLGSDKKVSLSPQCSLLFTQHFTKSLLDCVLHASHPLSITEHSLLVYISQLLFTMLHLNHHQIIIGKISASRTYIEGSTLYFADFSFAFDLSECTSDSRAELKSWLEMIPQDVFLTLPPELCAISDLPPSSESISDVSLSKCNVFAVGKLFQSIIEIHHQSRKFFCKLSDKFNSFLNKLVTSDTDKRLSLLDATLYSFALLYGPTFDKCCTLSDCQEWLMTETLQLLLSPSLKGHPTDYKTDANAKLMFTYLSLATPEKLLSIVELIEQTDTAR